MNEFAGTLPQNFTKLHHLANGSNSVGAVDEEMQTSDVPRETGTRELIAIIAAFETSPVKTMSVLQPASL